jgi:hypothetical protein
LLQKTRTLMSGHYLWMVPHFLSWFSRARLVLRTELWPRETMKGK